MSASDGYRRDVQRHFDEVAKLQRDKATEAKRGADHAKKASDAAMAASRASSLSSAQSKFRDAERYEKDARRSAEKVAEFERKIATEQAKLASAQEKLAKAEADEARKQRKSIDDAFRQQTNRSTTLASSIARTAQQNRHLDERIRRLEELPKTIVVLFLASNPLDQTQLRLDEEARAISENIRKSKHRDSVTLESRWATRPLDVLQALNELGPTVVHFSGHGTDQDEIVFQDDQGNAKLVSKAAIVQTLTASSNAIRLVFFNTCFSERQAQAVVAAIDAAIGMTTSIGDNAARVFAAQFYSAIGFGLSIPKAFAQAKAAVMLEGIPEENTPRLFLREGLAEEDLVLVQPPPRPQEEEVRHVAQ